MPNKYKDRLRPKPYQREIIDNENLDNSDKTNSETINSEATNSELNCESIVSVNNNLNPLLFINQTNMANNNNNPGQVDPFYSLKIPDAIKDLPKFEGNPRLLYDFITNVEEILLIVTSINNPTYGRILLRAIRNKIDGPANEVLNMYGTPLEWSQIKANLILHYADKRNETSLIKDLHNLRQLNKSIEQFYSEVIEIYSTIRNHIQIHNNDPNVVKAKGDLYSEMCLNIFLTGLREPIGSTIRSMKPNSLAEAFANCIKEQNMAYFRYEHKPLPKPSIHPSYFPIKSVPFKQTISNPVQPVFNNQKFAQSNTRPQIVQQQYRFPEQYQPQLQYRPQQSQQYRPQQFQQYRPQQQPFYQKPISTQYTNNVFQPKPTPTKTEPMDTLSAQTLVKKSPSGQTNTFRQNTQIHNIDEINNQIENTDDPNNHVPTEPTNLGDFQSCYAQDYYPQLDAYYDNPNENLLGNPDGEEETNFQSLASIHQYT